MVPLSVGLMRLLIYTASPSLTASEGYLTSAGWIAIAVPVSSESVATCVILLVRAWSVQPKDTFAAIQGPTQMCRSAADSGILNRSLYVRGL